MFITIHSVICVFCQKLARMFPFIVNVMFKEKRDKKKNKHLKEIEQLLLHSIGLIWICSVQRLRKLFSVQVRSCAAFVTSFCYL